MESTFKKLKIIQIGIDNGKCRPLLLQTIKINPSVTCQWVNGLLFTFHQYIFVCRLTLKNVSFNTASAAFEFVLTTSLISL